jgi:AraC family transcriptional regulator
MELRRLWNGETAQVLLSSWDRARHPADREARTRSAVIEFMRSGSYARHGSGPDLLIDANHVAFFNPVESFRVSHPCGDRNTGLTLRLSVELLAGVLADVDPQAPDRCDRPFRAPAALTSPRCHLLQNVLVGILSDRGAAEPVLVEEMLLRLVREATTGPHRGGGIAGDRGLGREDPGGRDRIENVRRFLLLHWAERLTLVELAGVAGCSCWHLASTFHARVGLPLHRYLKRLRLRHALERLHDGCSDLTRLALDCGFSSHSHFTAAFRQEFGTTPRVIRLTRSTAGTALKDLLS